MSYQQTKKSKRIRRHRRVRARIHGTEERPRFSVFRSNKYIYAQLINDETQKTLIGVSDKNISTKKDTKIDRAFLLGKHIAEKALDKKIKSVVFDRGGHQYKGRVKKVAEGAREGGLKF